MKFVSISFLFVTMTGLITAFPKYDTSNKDSVQNKRDYYDENENQYHIPETGAANQTEEGSQGRPPRFGFATYAQDVQTVGNTFPGLYGPVKLDIGGLVLGTIVGLGAFYILPKLFHVASTPYLGYRRSEDEANGGNGVSDMIAKVQENLNEYNAGSSVCLQRAICFSLQSAGEMNGNGTISTLASAVDGLVRNDIFQSLLNGTEWKRAVDAAERGEDCATVFDKCPKEINSIISTITKYVMS